MIIPMNRSARNSEKEPIEREPPSLWKSIILLIIFVFGAVSLFGVILYLFISGAHQMGWPPTAYIVILVVISGIFAWLVKRITDTVSGMSQYWFPEDADDDNR
jgi:hypothetical protein